MEKSRRLYVILLLLPIWTVAQPSLNKMQQDIASKGSYAQTGVLFHYISPTQAGIYFSDNNQLTAADVKGWLIQSLQLRPGIDELEADENVAVTPYNMSVTKFHQYYKNFKVEHGTINFTSKNAKASLMQLEFYSIPDNFSTSPAITAPQALQKAISFIQASMYSWGVAAEAATSPDAPKAELVIIKDYEKGDTVCLAYKFSITALEPFSAATVYVHASDGRIILYDSQAKHAERNSGSASRAIPAAVLAAGNEHSRNSGTVDVKEEQTPYAPLTSYSNSIGSAATKYNSAQVIYTDNNSGIAGKPYRLRATRNSQDIETYNLLQQPYNSALDQYLFATDFTDNDNNWTAAEFNNATWDNAALDVQFAMQIVSDYWLLVHGRNGWNNGNAPIKSYVHAYEYKTVNHVTSVYYLANAFWWKNKMTFGDGLGPNTASPPWTSLDICAHEMGHAITETTCSLIYQWESGALNEAFSDIWAACITKYALENYNLQNESVWRFGEKADNVGTANPGIRDMSNPGLYNDPSAYKNPLWKPASLSTCRTFDTTDNCGVHSNSGVLNKWFFLVTEGQQGTNSFGTPFNVTGLGFAKSEKIAYLTELNLTPNASYQTCRTVSLFATASLYGTGSPEYQTVWNAWVATAVDSNIYNMANTPAFTTNNFTSIAVGKNGAVLAGTNYSGVYLYSNSSWLKMVDLSDVRINDIKADYWGNFWIAQSGRSGTQSGGSSIAGGVNYLQWPYLTPAILYTIGNQADVPSRNARCIFIDTSRNQLITDYPVVWMAATSYITSSNSASGMLGKGVNSFTPAFTSVNQGINIASGTAGCLTVGGNSDTIWTFVQANNGINQLLIYNAATNALLRTFDHNSDPTIPSGFVARSIYCDAKKRTWIGLAAGGMIVYDENRTWHYLSPADFPGIFPTGSQASYNAIAGTKDGDVYIGTTTGLVYFERGDGTVARIDQPASYRQYGKPNGLPSAVINAIAYDTLNFKLLVATDSGIVFWEPLCIGAYCKRYKFKATEETQTTGPGNWSNPATWSTGIVPDSATNVTIKHNITVDIDAGCASLTLDPAVIFNILPGKKLAIYSKNGDTIYSGTGNVQRRRR